MSDALAGRTAPRPFRVVKPGWFGRYQVHDQGDGFEMHSNSPRFFTRFRAEALAEMLNNAVSSGFWSGIESEKDRQAGNRSGRD